MRRNEAAVLFAVEKGGSRPANLGSTTLGQKRLQLDAQAQEEGHPSARAALAQSLLIFVSPTIEMDVGKPPSPDDDADEIFAEEKERQAKQDASVAASWSKKVLVEGTGREAWQGARATLHIVGRRSHEDGEIFEDSRSREEPQLVLLGRGSVVLGLDRALLAMREGEHALVTVAPEGGYGAAGSHTYPIVPGSCTLVYDVEVVRLEEEGDLWDQSFGTKMRFAEERRARGNRLFKRRLYEWADAEYEQALRYLLYNPHPTPEESTAISAASLAVQLNLAASKLRCDRESEALAHAEQALQLQPEHPKALYRSAQAHTQRGEYAQARGFLRRAEAAAQGDSEVLKAVAQEGVRVEQRQGRHKRQQKRAYARMVQGGHEGRAEASLAGGPLRRSWRAAAGAARGDYGGAMMALVGAAVVAALAAALLLVPRLVASLVAAPGDDAE